MAERPGVSLDGSRHGLFDDWRERIGKPSSPHRAEADRLGENGSDVGCAENRIVKASLNLLHGRAVGRQQQVSKVGQFLRMRPSLGLNRHDT